MAEKSRRLACVIRTPAVPYAICSPCLRRLERNLSNKEPTKYENRFSSPLLLRPSRSPRRRAHSNGSYNQQLDNALQTYAVDQQLNALAAQAMRNNQNAVNQGLNLINPSPRTGCYSFGMRFADEFGKSADPKPKPPILDGRQKLRNGRRA